jgi:hypothetical protein
VILRQKPGNKTQAPVHGQRAGRFVRSKRSKWGTWRAATPAAEARNATRTAKACAPAVLVMFA